MHRSRPTIAGFARRWPCVGVHIKRWCRGRGVGYFYSLAYLGCARRTGQDCASGAPLSHDDPAELNPKQQYIEDLRFSLSSPTNAVVWESSTAGSEQQRFDGGSLRRPSQDDGGGRSDAEFCTHVGRSPQPCFRRRFPCCGGNG